MRNSKGQFVHGHALLVGRDKTGRFTRKTMVEPDIVLKIPEPVPVSIPTPEETPAALVEPVKPKEDTIIKDYRKPFLKRPNEWSKY